MVYFINIVMKISDLENKINEHLTINLPPNFTWLSQDLISMFTKEGSQLPISLYLTYGNFAVYQYKWTSISTLYGVIGDKNLLAFAEIKKFVGIISNVSGCHQLHKLERNKNIHSTDIPAALFHYFVQDLGYKLLSDKVMSDEGNKFWLKMVERAQVGITILDVVSGKNYLINDVKQGVYSDKDGARILEPTNDLKQDFFEDGTRKIRNEYRFYYCAEGAGSHLLKEHIEYRRNTLWPNEHMLLMFGQQNYNDYSK